MTLPDTSSQVRVLRGTRADMRVIWEWRNDSLSRAMSRNTDPISWSTHVTWFERMLADPQRFLFVGYIRESRMGMCRIDIGPDGADAEVSLVVAPPFRGKGLSSRLLQLATDEFCGGRPLPLIAHIRHDNIASARCFESCGFSCRPGEGPFRTYVRAAG